MPRTLTFQLFKKRETREFKLEPTKIDRPRLYGRSERLPVDNYGNALQSAAVDERGTTVIRSTGSGYLDAAGRWLSSADLRPVDSEGRPLPEVPSSFQEPIVLEERASLDDYYEHEISSVYVLHGDIAAELLHIVAAQEELFTFPFSYRGGHSPERGFLIAGRDRLFLVSGRRVQLEYLERVDSGRIDEFDEPDEPELDFSFSAQRSGRGRHEGDS